jgi:peptide/nickel transport system ATP-binding protein
MVTDNDHLIKRSRFRTSKADASRPSRSRPAVTAAPALLEVRDLHVAVRTAFERVPILRGVSLDVAPGEILGVVGESGAGKSMIGSAVTGLLEPPLVIAGGEIRFAGRRIDDLLREQLRRLRGAEIATIFQDPLTSLNPVFTIGRQLAETIELHTDMKGAAARDEAAALLARVGIPAPAERLASYPHEFSGGMRQRVVIALALAGRPKLIVADEPTTALDVSVQWQIIELLRDLCEERGTAVILITHDMGVIAALAGRVAVAYAGRIVEIGPTRDVIADPAHPYTRGLMASIPEIGQRRHRLTQIPGAMPRPTAVPAGCAFAPRCPSVMDRCRVDLPVLAGADGHAAACWLAPGVPAA